MYVSCLCLVYPSHETTAAVKLIIFVYMIDRKAVYKRQDTYIPHIYE